MITVGSLLSRFGLFSILLAGQGISYGNTVIPPRPELPSGYLEQLENLKSDLDELVPGESPMKTLGNARKMLVNLENWRTRMDATEPPGWREKLKKFSIACRDHDRRMRNLQATNRISPAELENWDLYLRETAEPMWLYSGENMTTYRAEMDRYRKAVRYWLKIVREYQV